MTHFFNYYKRENRCSERTASISKCIHRKNEIWWIGESKKKFRQSYVEDYRLLIRDVGSSCGYQIFSFSIPSIRYIRLSSGFFDIISGKEVK